jgi:hypothetical protein
VKLGNFLTSLLFFFLLGLIFGGGRKRQGKKKKIELCQVLQQKRTEMKIRLKK